MFISCNSTPGRNLLKGFRANSIYILILFVVNIPCSIAQNIPLDQWESHFSYLSAQHIVEVENQIFCSSYNGLFHINTDTKEVKVLSKAEGISDTGISSMAYDATDKMLVLTYRSGNIDLISLNDQAQPQQIVSWPVLVNASDLPEKKQINQILFRQDIAYLATSFGVVVLNIKLREVQETYRYIGSNGREVNVKGIAFASDSIYALTETREILVSSMQPSVNRQYFANWKITPLPAPAVAISYRSDYIYAGFPGKGILKKSGGSWISVYPTSSQYYSFLDNDESIIATLDNKVVVITEDNPPRLFENALFSSPKESIFKSEAIWTADSKNGLISNIGNDFKSYSPSENDTTISQRSDSTVIDQNGNSWTHLPSYLGGGILFKNLKTGQERILGTSVGNGGLPSSNINSLAVDQDGYIWFASDNGVGFLFPDDILNATRIDATMPVYGHRKLFSNEKCTAIAIEPGNRKWIGTRNGLYLFNQDGTDLIQQFTAEASPLPSNNIIALHFIPAEGILLIDTPKGMVAYRSNSSVSSENFSSATIFPNPVHPGYAGQIGIKGLMDNSVVKIIQLSGKLVYETQSHGGTASWNLNDYSGRRVRGGIYLVLIISGDGEQKLAGKLAIIE